MVAVKEKHFKSVKTDASLYNGQPTDTGTMCHSAEATSSTSPISKCKDGVSVENVHAHSKQWFVLRVSYGRMFIAKEIIDAHNVEVMDNFIKLTSIKNPHIIPVTSQNIQYKLGDHVIVTEGNFEGIQGRVARIAGQQRVIVELFSGCLVATAYIPKEAMEKKKINLLY